MRRLQHHGRLGWIPILQDPDDEPLVQLAYDSGSRRIISHNLRDLAPARAIGVETLQSREFAALSHVAMKLHVELPESLVAQARDLAAREQTTLDALIASSLAATLDHAPQRPTITERAARVDCQKVDAILARVPATPPQPGDER